MHVVIGAGEVGLAVAEVLRPHFPVAVRDVMPSGPDQAEVLHICFPYDLANPGLFERAVDEYRADYQAELVIVHSSVPVGTCDALGVCHSPVTGRHPDLATSILRFTKFFGGEGAADAAAFFELAGCRVEVCNQAADTEAGKLWELAQYGLQIGVEKVIHAWCVENNVPFATVYTRFAESYNRGYAALGLGQFVRPIIKHMPGAIGGHCVVPGSEMLHHMVGDLVVSLSKAAAEMLQPAPLVGAATGVPRIGTEVPLGETATLTQE